MYRHQTLHGPQARQFKNDFLDEGHYSQPLNGETIGPDEEEFEPDDATWTVLLGNCKAGTMSNCVKSPAIWDKAQEAVKGEKAKGDDAYWGSAMRVYQNMGGKMKRKKTGK